MSGGVTETTFLKTGLPEILSPKHSQFLYYKIRHHNDKRHRSSSSLAGVALEGTRSERKLEINVSIPEVEDQFAVAEKRCDNLQDKINLIQSLKRKKKLKKRSMTKVIEQPETSPKNIPSISVRTYPKKKVLPQAARTRRPEMPASHPTRGYLDPATVEQHRMIGQVRGYNNAFNRPSQERSKVTDHKTSRSRLSVHQRFKAEGDSLSGHDIQEDSASIEGARRNNDRYYNNDYDDYDRHPEKTQDSRHNIKLPSTRRRRVPIEDPIVQEKPVELSKDNSSLPMPKRWLSTKARKSSGTMVSTPPLVAEPVVELFNKHYGASGFDKQSTLSPPSPPRNPKTALPNNITHNQPVKITPLQQHPRKVLPRRVKYKSRRYELPTVASQMKQAGLRYYYDSNNHTNIPFVVSKSTAPSHNIGVNIQQVLNGLKMQQPLSGIPLTIAYHMGLSHVPSHGTKSAAAVRPESQERAINAIKVGRRMLRLPSYKYMSYKRLLTLYREGDGIVPRFLKAMSRPHYFYTSLYNLATNREDLDGTTSKGNITSLETKQNIAQFAGLYREYEKLNKYCKEGNYDHKLEVRKEELSKELIAREHKLRKVLQEYRPVLDLDPPLRASASTVEDTYRHSKYKLDADDSPQ